MICGPNLLLLLLLPCWFYVSAPPAAAFAPSSFQPHCHRQLLQQQHWQQQQPSVGGGRSSSDPTTTALFMAKKNTKKRRSTTGKGFGADEQPQPVTATTKRSPGNVSEEKAGYRRTLPDKAVTTGQEDEAFLRSVTGGSDAIPVVDNEDEEESDPEERAKRILREKYGMRSLEEQQVQTRQADRAKERQRKMNRMMEKAGDPSGDGGFDLLKVLPPSVIVAIDGFLKAGATVTGLLFVAAGIGITLEAWSKTSGSPLPDDLDAFIVDVVEPNFTTGLFVLLGFSVSLGLFAAAQLGSASAVYREDGKK